MCRYFKEASNDDGFEKSDSKIRIRIGGFETPFHKLGLRIIATEDDLDDDAVRTTTGTSPCGQDPIIWFFIAKIPNFDNSSLSVFLDSCKKKIQYSGADDTPCKTLFKVPEKVSCDFNTVHLSHNKYLSFS